MRKRRRVWWIMGAFGAAVALFAAVAFFLDYNSTDARVERFVSQIVSDLNLTVRSDSTNASGSVALTIIDYEGMPVDQDVGAAIAQAMKREFPQWEYQESSLPATEDHTPGDGVPFFTDYGIKHGEVYGPELWIIVFTPNDMGYYEPGSPAARLTVSVSGLSRRNAWQRIKEWLPW